MARTVALILALVLPCWVPAGARAKDDTVWTGGTVTVGGRPLAYRAAAGTITVHQKGWDEPSDERDDDRSATAAMFYVAYFASTEKADRRPIMFLFNGGPGSSSVWLHMGSFGPRRVVVSDAAQTPAAPYRLVNNDETLLDTSDLVFIDAPGTGFGRLSGKDPAHAFWGADQDAYAFAEFIATFLSRFGRWNSPKYLFGESYGTARAAMVAAMLENDMDLDLNGIVLLSTSLNFDLSPDGPSTNPGVDLPYALALPTYAATAWYHGKLDARHADLSELLGSVESFATGDYLTALAAGAALDPGRRKQIASRLHDLTGLPLEYIDRANLRVDGGEFEQNLLGGEVTGRLDTRFTGPALDPLAKEAGYDPEDAATDSASVSLFNDYVRRTLRFGEGRTYRAELDPKDWDLTHRQPGMSDKPAQSLNVMPDLASALVGDPDLRVQVDAGLFDLATPFFEGLYEMRHLPIPQRLQANIEYRQYRSGHMVYINDAARKALRDNVADFISRTHRAG